MSVLLDSSILMLIVDPSAPSSIDPSTGQPVHMARERIDFLVRKIGKTRTKVIIPAPVLSEVLVYAGTATSRYVEILQASPFRVVAFDTRAAIECAEAVRRRHLRKRKPGSNRGKVKFDEQIAAIAKVEQVSAIYSDDEDMIVYGEEVGIPVIRSWELEIDPADRQGVLPLDPREADVS